MMNIPRDKLMQMQAEMARFENEIAGRFMRPPMPRPGGDMALRFIPHALRRGPAAHYPPPMGLAGHVFAPGRMFQPRMAPVVPHPSSASVIEAAPTRYMPPSTFQSVPPLQPTIAAPPMSMPQQPNLEIEAAKKRMAAERAGVPGASSAAAGAGASNKPAEMSASSSKMSKRQQASGSKASTSKTIRPKRYVRTAGGEVWEDSSLLEWDPNDFRLFCGDLGNEVSDELLAKAFRKYPSFQKAKVIREKRTNKTKGYGFVSFKDPQDFIRALREMDGKYVGNRPIKLRKSQWKDRNINSVKKKLKEKHKLGLKL